MLAGELGLMDFGVLPCPCSCSPQGLQSAARLSLLLHEASGKSKSVLFQKILTEVVHAGWASWRLKKMVSEAAAFFFFARLSPFLQLYTGVHCQAPTLSIFLDSINSAQNQNTRISKLSLLSGWWRSRTGVPSLSAFLAFPSTLRFCPAPLQI